VTVLSGKDDTSVIKIGLRNLKILRDLVSTRRFRKTNQTYDGIEESYYVHSDGAEFSYDTTVRKSFSYGSLHTMNFGALFSAPRIGDDEG
jgi:hypothetical protein